MIIPASFAFLAFLSAAKVWNVKADPMNFDPDAAIYAYSHSEGDRLLKSNESRGLQTHQSLIDGGPVQLTFLSFTDTLGPFEFASLSALKLRVSDDFLTGDVYGISDKGVPIGETDTLIGGGFLEAELTLCPGFHSIELVHCITAGNPAGLFLEVTTLPSVPFECSIKPCIPEPTPVCSAADKFTGSDDDEDCVVDSADNCPTGFNPGQENADADLFGDVCDNCPTVANDDQDLSACVDECGPCASILSDDFDDYGVGMFDPVGTELWASASGASVADNCGVVSPGSALTFGAFATPTREVVSKSLFGGFSDLTLSFSLKIGSAGTDDVCEDADDYFFDEDDEDVDLAFYIGGEWVTYAVFDTEAFNFFTCIEVPIPAGATKFKIFQPAFSGSGFDEWAIDDVQIKSCECCHPLLTANIDVVPPEALYYAANGRTGFVACFNDQFPQLLNFGFQECSAPGAPQLLWNGTNGSDGLDPPAACVAPGAVTDTGGYCIIDGWMPMMGSTCCADLSFTGFVPINGGTQFVQCDQGRECAVQDCGLGANDIPLVFDVNCPWDDNGCCNYPDFETVDESTFSDCMPQGNSDRLLIEDDHNLRGVGH